MASPGDPKSQNPGPELSKPTSEPANQTEERPSFLATSEPIREDQVQNAVNFLSHPKVKGSPVIYRRSFLEKKGLTKDEIDEAFRRVPDPASNATPVSTVNQAAQPNLSTSIQPQAPIQSSQSVGIPNVATAIVPAVHQPRFLWSHALIAACVLAASGAGTAIFFKKVVIPKLKSWIRKVVAEEKEPEKQDEQTSVLAEQTTEAAKAAAAAAAAVAKASEELLSSKNEEKRYFEAFMNMMDVQVKEMKSMGEAIRKLESKREHNNSQDKSFEEHIRASAVNGTTDNSTWRGPQVNQSSFNYSSSSEQLRMNGMTYADNAEVVRPSSTPAAIASTLHPKSYTEIRNMVQRVEERPPYIKPWEVPSQHPTYSEVVQSSMEENGKSQNYSSEASWKNKSAKITEIEPEDDYRYRAGGFSQKGWVPPQPPGVAIPESAAAIRQPKSSVQKQQSNEIVSSSDGEVISDASFNDFHTRNEAGGSSSVSKIEEVRDVGVESN